MASINAKSKSELRTHGGAKAQTINLEQQLKRSVMACMLWEDSFYEDGVSIAERIETLSGAVKPEKVAETAIAAREDFKLRHVPLLLARGLAKKRHPVASLLERIIQRPDELTEFLAIYWKNGKEPLSSQVKKGLGNAFKKFNEYQLAKYDRQTAIRLKDVLFLSHPKPKDKEQEALWKRLIDGKLAIPDTWEVNLSSGKDKKEVWTAMLTNNSLGALALIRNLRNMLSESVDLDLIREAILKMKTERVLPFRFITAAKYAPKLEPELEQAMFKCVDSQEKLKGKTILIVDTSGSMYGARNVSKNSELSRIDAAAALAILIKEISENPVIYATAGDDRKMIHATKELPARRGFALSDKIVDRSLFKEIGSGGIFLKQVMDYVYDKEKEADRVIVITDEQDCDQSLEKSPSKANAFGKNNYLINVSVESNGIGYGKWTHFDGWSEAIVSYIREFERSQYEQ
jgi:hypothetical protein